VAAGTSINAADPPLIARGHTLGSVTDRVVEPVLRQPTPPGWTFGFRLSLALLALLPITITYLLAAGVGIWGINIPVAWGFDIVNFVWWIGIGHGGTLISSILLLLRQTWRNSVNRSAEAITLFAMFCAALFPLLHMGRPWLAYWMLPIPNSMGIWPQFRSPLIWDVFAVTTYITVSFLLWYVGLIPDVATLRDRALSPAARKVYGVLALGWRGSARQWARHDTTYLLLAGLATALGVSVHSIVSFDFAMSIIPGWHATIFAPYFATGAIYSGFAMVLTFIIPLRKAYGLEDFITVRHLRNISKIMLVTGLIVAHAYLTEVFMAWYSVNPFERSMALHRLTGPYAGIYWTLVVTNFVIPQALWFRPVNRNVYLLFIIALSVNVGMWLERFVIVVTSLHRDFLPSAWGRYMPTIWDWSMFLGTIGLFLTLFFLFVRVLPSVAMFEMRLLIPRSVDRDHVD
jgi:molybdopterin-containing oxidoreductase family membrane subunit